MGWKDSIQPIQDASSAGSWKDSIQDIKEDPGMLESLGRGVAQGVSGGFQDELGGAIAGLGRAAGFKDLEHGFQNGFESAPDGVAVSLGFDGPHVDWDKIKQAYADARDKERRANTAAAQANPNTYLAGNIGGGVLQNIAVPGLSAAGDAGLVANIGKGALQGTLAGAGYSDADNLEGLAKDTAVGAALGGGAGAVGYGAGKAVGKIASSLPSAGKALPKVASFLTGVDEDAAARQLQRPAQTAAAQGDDYVYKLAKQAMGEAEQKGQTLGQNVARAGNKFQEDSGNLVFEGAKGLADDVGDFMIRHQPSKMGFSALSNDEMSTLNNLRSTLQSGDVTGEDLFKLREYLDHAENLAGKYDKDGTGPYVNFLKGLRHKADGMIDSFDPNLDQANKAFGQYKSDTGLLRGATNEGQAESMVGNLYGANKGAKQEAAARLFSPETMDSAKDIAANKAFENAKRPGGDNYFRRGALAVLTSGASEIATSPNLWKGGLRLAGKFSGDQVGQLAQQSPGAFGKFANIMRQAASRGPEAVASTHFILEQIDPAYREVLRTVADGDDQQQ